MFFFAEQAQVLHGLVLNVVVLEFVLFHQETENLLMMLACSFPLEREDVDIFY